MFYVYALKSLKNGDLYIGFTKDLKQRYAQHNSKKVQSTSVNVPWKLVYYEAYLSKLDATKREKQLKMHRVKSDLRLQISYSFEENRHSGEARSRFARRAVIQEFTKKRA